MNLFNSLIAAPAANVSPVLILNRSVFTANNATQGTGIASKDAAVAREATAGNMVVYNTSLDSEAKIIVPLRLRLRATAVNTTASDGTIEMYTDEIDRFTSGGVVLASVPTIASRSDDFTAPATKARINFGTLVLPAASDENKIWGELVSSTIAAVGDVYDIWFSGGSSDSSAVTGHPDTTTFHAPPIWLKPGGCLIVQHYGTSQAADPAFEVEFWYAEHGGGAN